MQIQLHPIRRAMLNVIVMLWNTLCLKLFYSKKMLALIMIIHNYNLECIDLYFQSYLYLHLWDL